MQECSTHIQVKKRKKLLKYYYASYTYIYMYHVVFAVSLNYPNRLHPLDMRMQYFLEYLLICLFTIPGKACIIFHFNLFKMYISKIGVDIECYISSFWNPWVSIWILYLAFEQGHKHFFSSEFCQFWFCLKISSKVGLVR